MIKIEDVSRPPELARRNGAPQKFAQKGPLVGRASRATGSM
jgi:hypothetical protein